MLATSTPSGVGLCYRRPPFAPAKPAGVGFRGLCVGVCSFKAAGIQSQFFLVRVWSQKGSFIMSTFAPVFTPINPTFLVDALFLSASTAGYSRGWSITHRPSGAIFVSFGIRKGLRWSAALSFFYRALEQVGVRHRVVRYGVRSHFFGFAVVIARGQGL